MIFICRVKHMRKHILCIIYIFIDLCTKNTYSSLDTYLYKKTYIYIARYTGSSPVKLETGFQVILATLQCVHTTTFFRKGLDGNEGSPTPQNKNKIPHASKHECFQLLSKKISTKNKSLKNNISRFA